MPRSLRSFTSITRKARDSACRKPAEPNFGALRPGNGLLPGSDRLIHKVTGCVFRSQESLLLELALFAEVRSLGKSIRPPEEGVNSLLTF